MPPWGWTGSASGRITSGRKLRAVAQVSASVAPVTVGAVPSTRPASIRARRTTGKPPASWNSSIRKAPDGLRLTMQGHVAAEAVPVGEGERHAGPAGQRQEMDDGVGRAADGGVGADGVGEGGAGEESRERQVLADELDDAVAGEVGQHLTVHVDGGDAGIVRQGHAHDLAQGGHGRGGAHGLAGAGRAVDAALGLEKLGRVDQAGRQLLGEAPGVAGADRPAAEAAAEQRPGGDDDRRQVGAGGTHEQGRRGLVAADQQHDAVERVAADRFLDLHGARLRNSMALGRSVSSPRDIAGNSSGTPPASQTPRFTCSASSRSEALQGLRSDQLLQMPMIGLPWNSWSGRPSWRCTARCMKPVLSRPSNQVLDRNRLSSAMPLSPGLPRAGP